MSSETVRRCVGEGREATQIAGVGGCSSPTLEKSHVAFLGSPTSRFWLSLGTGPMPFEDLTTMLGEASRLAGNAAICDVRFVLAASRACVVHAARCGC